MTPSAASRVLGRPVVSTSSPLIPGNNAVAAPAVSVLIPNPVEDVGVVAKLIDVENEGLDESGANIRLAVSDPEGAIVIDESRGSTVSSSLSAPGERTRDEGC